MPAWADLRQRRLSWSRLVVLAGTWLILVGEPATAAQGGLGAQIELVDPQVLRVCADPRNMPFSNEAGEGFENELAELVAEKSGRSRVSYTFFPQGMGFVRNTLGAHRCDVIMGYAQGDELVQNTNPYYRSAYALAVRADSDIADLTGLDDPRLQDKRIGVVVQTPPATALARHGLMDNARPYQLMVDTRIDAPVQTMFEHLAEGTIDVALAWGPMAGYYAMKSEADIIVTPLLETEGGPRMTYRITMGVRPSDQEWKRRLNTLIRENQEEINELLLRYGVPLLDEQDRPITAGQ